MNETTELVALEHLRDLVANDGFSIQFQTMGAYRTAVIGEIDRSISCIKEEAAQS